MELNMANLKKKKKKDYCLSAAWQALWELSDGFGGQLSNYHHTLKFLLVSPDPCWFLLTLRICWWFQNPFWRHKVFLFLVSSRSSFPYIHISSSLDFSPVLHNRVITMVPFFLPCWVCTWNIICCITFFFFSTGSLQKELIIILSLHVINGRAGAINPEHLSNLVIVYTWAFSCINLTVHNLTRSEINIPPWLSHHFLISCSESTST